jgi:cytoplasmic iron level regulating protein YaaA (DUF328/UPF0246 family)
MILLLSPAKTLDYESKVPVEKSTSLLFKDEVSKLAGVLKKKSKKEIGELMSLSEKLADLNFQRYQEFKLPEKGDDSRQALFAFKGDVYQGLDAYTLSSEAISFSEDHLRILSGLYGVLRPLDLMQPYRLEMGTSLQVKQSDNLYEFWKSKLTAYLNEELKNEGSGIVLNLASNEYFGAIDSNGLDARVVEPTFKDYKNGKLKTISFFLKKARGYMARYVLENQISNPEDLRGFNTEGYSWSEELSSENKPVFIR